MGWNSSFQSLLMPASHFFLTCYCSSPCLLVASGLQQTLPHSPRLFKTLLLRHLPIRLTGIWVSFVSWPTKSLKTGISAVYMSKMGQWQPQLEAAATPPHLLPQLIQQPRLLWPRLLRPPPAVQPKPNGGNVEVRILSKAWLSNLEHRS